MSSNKKQKRFIGPVLFATIFLAHQSAFGQVNKYRSKTNFNPDTQGSPQPRMDESSTPDVDTMTAEDAAAALKAAEKLEKESQTLSDSEEEDNESAFAGDEDDDANQETFGDRPAPKQGAQPKETKYVNLNPETAFGPEIVESFDFPDTDIMEITKHMQKLRVLTSFSIKMLKVRSLSSHQLL